MKTSKKTWQIIKSAVGGPQDDPAKISDVFCEYFSNIESNQSSNIQPPQNINVRGFYQHIQLKVNECTEVDNSVRSMKSSSARDDKVNLKLIKYILTTFLEDFSGLINSSFKAGIFPDYFKTADVTPLFK
ncbi:hypothetical protein QYM36_015622 [Artemia franciscana]|uniref:Uncharacterized protein n=1 Tax=Artemia franciscana TaxID=6661 RepID=A0AA88HJ39_ARTSF|nr:hypothetical protein QYM36_015622 [Artemia franciscana]